MYQLVLSTATDLYCCFNVIFMWFLLKIHIRISCFGNVPNYSFGSLTSFYICWMQHHLLCLWIAFQTQIPNPKIPTPENAVSLISEVVCPYVKVSCFFQLCAEILKLLHPMFLGKRTSTIFPPPPHSAQDSNTIIRYDTFPWRKESHQCINIELLLAL